MTHRRLIVALALLYALAHLPFLPAALEDIDSVNFALGVRDFDVADDRPHPPGYPVYIAFGKVSAAMVGGLSSLAPASAVEARALAWLSLLAGGAAVVLLYRVYACAERARDGDRVGAPWTRPHPRALAVVVLTAACPLFWYMGARPMSDMPGLAATLAAQACLALAWWRQRPAGAAGRRLAPDEMAASGRMIVLGALIAALAVGVCPQALWLTAPLLLAVLFDRIGRGAAGAVLGSAMTYTFGVLVWAVPLLVASGGLGAYMAAVGGQAGDGFGVEMLYRHPSVRLLASGLVQTFILPWDSYWLGGIIVLLAAVGAVALARGDRRSLVLVSLLAGPYLAFHLLFQDPAFVRDALPLVPPTVLLAVTGVGLMGRRALVPVTAALGVAALALGVPTLAAYASEPGPVRRAVSAMRDASGEAPAALGLDFVYRRPLEAGPVPVTPQLPSPAGREWLELVDLWRRGVTSPVWFLANPARTDLALVDPASRQSLRRFRLHIDSLSQMGGMRPSAVDWYVLSPPGWFAGTGWALTPETAGVARVMEEGPSRGPISAWVRRRDDTARILVGGRNLGGPDAPAARFTLAIDGRDIESWDCAPGFFLRVINLPAGTLVGHGDLAELTIVSTPVSGAEAVPTAIEQFDLQTAGSMMWGYGEGWHEAEYSPTLGMWRWMSDRGELRVVDARGPLRLTLVVEPVARSFARPSMVTVRAGDRVLASSSLDGTAPWTVELPADALAGGDGRLVIETDQVFVPAETGGPPDHRRLGLRVFSIALAPIQTAMR